MNPLKLYEAYSAVYDEDLREDMLSSLDEDFDAISELNDEEIDEIVEETIFDLLDEGYEIEDIEEIFEEVLSEAKVTMGRGGEAGEGKVTTGSGSRMAAADRLAARRVRKRKEAVEKVKGAVKKAVADTKEKAKEAKFKAVDAPAARYAAKRGIGGPAPGLSARSKDPAKRRALRGAVLKDIASRAKAKLGRGIEKARAAGERAVGAVKSTSDTAQAKMRSAGKSAVGKGARAVQSGAKKLAKGAGKLAKRLGEEVDLYDLVLEHLIQEGYAETEEAATVIMANMSEEWREEIINQY